MALIPLVLDPTAPIPRDARGGESILDLPLGAGTVFQALLERLGPLADGRILLMRSGPTPAAEGRKPPAPGGVPGVSVCGPDGLDGLLDELDCADDLCAWTPLAGRSRLRASRRSRHRWANTVE